MSDERSVWYRKWRPRSFAEIYGQDHVTRTLRNAVAVGRVAHAYLLCGPRGTGKTTTARVLAKAVNCTNAAGGEPCDRCDSCIAVREGRALDLVEMDAASNRGIDDIRELRERVGYAASGGRFKVYLIDEVHELTQQAFDALLKTLEEPPPHVIFVLATTDAHKVPATILSRCQRFDLTRVRLPDLTARLRLIAVEEGVEIDDDALALIGRAATGSLRDGVNLMEQLVASQGAVLTAARAREGLGLTGDRRAFDLAGLALAGDLAGGLSLIAAVRDDGVDLRQFTRELSGALRSLLLLKAGVAEGIDADTEQLAALRALAAASDLHAISRALKVFGSADFRADPQASLPLELALVEVALTPVAADVTPSAPSFAEARQARRQTDSAAPNPPVATGSARNTSPLTPGALAQEPAAEGRARQIAPEQGGAPRPELEPVALRPVATLTPRSSVDPGAGEVAQPPPASEAELPPAHQGTRLAASAGSSPARRGEQASASPGRNGSVAVDSLRDRLAERAAMPSPNGAASRSLRPATAQGDAASAARESGGAAAAEAALPSSKPRGAIAADPGSVSAADIPAPPTGAAPSLAEARGRYRQVYEEMRRANRLAAARINPGDIVAIDGESVTFGLPHRMQVDNLEPGSNAHTALLNAVAAVFGRRYAVHCSHVKDAEDRLRAQPTRPSHLLDEALKLGARQIS